MEIKLYDHTFPEKEPPKQFLLQSGILMRRSFKRKKKALAYDFLLVLGILSRYIWKYIQQKKNPAWNLLETSL